MILFSNISLQHIDHLEESVNRVIVGPTITEYWIDNKNDNIGEKLGIKTLARTHHATTDTDDYIRTHFYHHLSEFIKTGTRLVIYADNEAFDKIASFWFLQLFNRLTFHQFSKIHTFIGLERMCSEENFTWDVANKTKQRNRYNEYIKPDPDIKKLIAFNRKALPLEYQLIGCIVSRDVDDEKAIADAVIQRIAIVTVEVARGLITRICLMYSSKTLQTLIDGDPTPPLDGNCPVNAITALNLTTITDNVVKDLISTKENRDDFRESFKQDLITHQRIACQYRSVDDNVADILKNFDIMYLDNAFDVIKAYIEALDNSDRYQFLVPRSLSSVITNNVLLWSWHFYENHSGAVTPCWIET